MSQIKGHTDFNIDQIPSLEGKVIFVTGGTAGIGLECVQVFASTGASHIYFTGRNRKSGETLIEEISSKWPGVGMTFLEMDMLSLSSVKSAVVEGFKHQRLDILLCNAGIMDKPPALSVDGFEIHFAVNHLAHAMMIRHLLPTLNRTAAAEEEEEGEGKKKEGKKSDVRIVMVTSEGWRLHPGDGISFETIRTPQSGSMESLRRYGQSKLSNIIYARSLSSRTHQNITSLAVHPGVVRTELITSLPKPRRVFVEVTSRIFSGRMMDPDQGRLNHLWVCTMGMENKGEKLVNGGYYTPIGVLSDAKLDRVARDEGLAGRLWEFTEGVLDQF